MSVIIGIDASRCRSGGAVNHLIGILSNIPDSEQIEELHVWSYRSLLKKLPYHHKLKLHEHSFLEKNLLFNVIWQFFLLKRSLNYYGCNILFTADASTVLRYSPQVVLSQDLLSYESNILNKYSWSYAKFRIILIKHLQNIAFKRAVGTIFLNNYSRLLIEKQCGILEDSIIIPHGVNEDFLNVQKSSELIEGSCRLIYISNAEIYKNHFSVLKAFKILLDLGYNVSLTFVGGGDERVLNRFKDFIIENHISPKLFKQFGFLKKQEVLDLMSSSDIFIFASTCESFGITLLEGMASGMPIACSNKSSLPELLLDNGVYFDPEDPCSIAVAVELLINDNDLRARLSNGAKELAKTYSWNRTAIETFNFILSKTSKL
jgi:glycosyltransferase involved in cell wall biosynthesis